MKLTDISKEELETMNYDDIAYIILNENKKAEKINVLFKSVCDALNLSEAEYEAKSLISLNFLQQIKDLSC